MGDYKRMLLAVIIASVFIFIWTTFFSEPPRRRGTGPTGVPDSVEVADIEDDTTDFGGRPAGEPGRRGEPSHLSTRETAQPPTQERPSDEALRGIWLEQPGWERMVAETGLCKGELVSLGGGLSSWKLKEFLDQEKAPVDLVVLRPGATSELGLDLVSGGAFLSLDDAPFSRRELPSDDPDVEKMVALTATDSAGSSVTRIYTFYRNSYFFDVDVTAEGFGRGERLSCALSWSYGLPITEANEKSDIDNFAAMSLLGEEFHKDKRGDFKDEPVKELEGNVRWTGLRNKYFVVALIPPTEQPGTAVRTWGDPTRNLVATQLFVPMKIADDGEAAASFRVYAGPMDYDKLVALGVGLEKDVYQRFRFMAPLNHLVFALMQWVHGLVPNYGVVIILVSVLIKLIFYPLTRSSLRSMQAMKKVQPELEALKKKYKGDPKKMNQAQMELFRKHKVNPLGGCLPILVQMPIFFALYNVLVESVQLRQADFVAWIDDLSAPDTLFHFGDFPVHLLPLVMAATQLVQPTMGPSTDPKQKMMKYLMPIFLLVIFYGLPSGLVLYWTVNNVLTALQQYLMNRSEKTDEGSVTVAPSRPTKRKGRASNK